jgi:hypothetical protein
MPTMQNSVSVAANAVSTNQLAGEQYEFLPGNAQVVLSTTGSATGLRVSFLAGGVSLIDDQAIGLQNRFPVVPDDIITQEVIPAGARLILKFRNTTAGALTAYWRVDVSF